MALCNSKLPTHFRIQQSLPVLFLNFLMHTIVLFLLVPFANSISFNLSNFNADGVGIYYQKDATPANGVIQLTKNQRDASLRSSVGRASYSNPIYLWDNITRSLTDFNTHFSFNISSVDPNSVGDGLAFFLSPYNAKIPVNSSGGFLGLFENSTALNHTNNQIVAVEFDTFLNPSCDPSSNHIGINVNEIESVAYLNWSTSLVNNTETANAWVNYDSATTTLSVYLTYEENPVFQGNYILSYVVDLREVLPPLVSVGFSAATGSGTEIHKIISWTFNSTLKGLPSTGMSHKTNPHLMVGLAVGLGVEYDAAEQT